HGLFGRSDRQGDERRYSRVGSLTMGVPFYDAETVAGLLDYPGCIAAMRNAMAALSTCDRDQPLRQIVSLREGAMFGVMPGDLSSSGCFGAKLISVFHDPEDPRRSRHRGVVAAFDAATGELKCLADAEPVTAIRTACATAAATDALARADAQVLAVFGTGMQAETHLRAVRLVRPFAELIAWGRSPEAFASRMSAELGVPVTPVADARKAAERADVICTVSGSHEPILRGEWVQPGTHVNLVGSSALGAVEIDTALVTMARYIADYRPGVLTQGSEFAAARSAGAVTDDHVVGEIGEVFAGRLTGRQNAAQVTLYKTLGHIVQDLAAAAYIHARATNGTTTQ
ncbi:MAG TPA: ornithine cyclodeaminase family protein, partial [Afipia sp.]